MEPVAGPCPRHRSGHSVRVAMGRFDVLLHDGVPPLYDSYRDSAEVGDEFAVGAPEGRLLFMAVFDRVAGALAPRLSVLQRFEPCGEGFTPGVAVGAGGNLVLLGAGERILAYQVGPYEVTRLWEDEAAGGFLGWDVQRDAVLMAAELELSAWSADGARRLWTMAVEPPWSHHVQDEEVSVDVMGDRVTFGLLAGPSRTDHPPRSGR